MEKGGGAQARKEGGSREERKIKKRSRRNGLAESGLPFSSFFKLPLSYSLPRDIVFLCDCVSGQVYGCVKASVQKAQINPTAYVFRNYHVC